MDIISHNLREDRTGDYVFGISGELDNEPSIDRAGVVVQTDEIEISSGSTWPVIKLLKDGEVNGILQLQRAFINLNLDPYVQSGQIVFNATDEVIEAVNRLLEWSDEEMTLVELRENKEAKS